MNPLGTNSGVNKTRVYTRTPPCQRFMRFLVVNPETLCWEWRGGKHSAGYGSFKAEGINLAHRFAYAIWVGPLIPSLTIDHLCRNRRCVNPEHLEQVPIEVNVLRGQGVTVMHSKQTHCIRGHPFTPDNIYRPPSRPHTRDCRQCMKMRAKNSGRRRTERERKLARWSKKRAIKA